MNSIAYEIRVKELSRMSKPQLAHIWWALHPNTVHVAAPPEKWNKDELVNDVLRAEFPNGAQVESLCKCAHAADEHHMHPTGMWCEHVDTYATEFGTGRQGCDCNALTLTAAVAR